MMNYKSLYLLTLVVTLSCSESNKNSDSQNNEHSQVILLENFKSKFVDNRNVEVFLPTGYDANSDTPYKVLYMHDGQNVFNPKTSYTGIDWGVDEAVDSLIKIGKIKKTIVVASWNTPKRFNEYMPKAPDDITEEPEMKEKLLENSGYDQLYSDEYLRFLVEELKPYVDSTYNTSTKLVDTSIMGSSMGGLISLYAICKYPDVFGAAGCISTHWPVPVLGEAYIKTLPESLPSPENHRIYFDHGTETLDAQYEPFQIKVDSIMVAKGFTKGENWITKTFEGAEHNEKSWKARIHIPLEFLLN
ncbi:MAG: esterase [Cyclobacteriaceae bacterium]|nr:esterase [Cyclobacteriaceae bacterium]